MTMCGSLRDFLNNFGPRPKSNPDFHGPPGRLHQPPLGKQDTTSNLCSQPQASFTHYHFITSIHSQSSPLYKESASDGDTAEGLRWGQDVVTSLKYPSGISAAVINLFLFWWLLLCLAFYSLGWGAEMNLFFSGLKVLTFILQRSFPRSKSPFLLFPK